MHEEEGGCPSTALTFGHLNEMTQVDKTDKKLNVRYLQGVYLRCGHVPETSVSIWPIST